jgi:hypothetical protein
MQDLLPCAVADPTWRRADRHVSERRVCTPRKRRRHVISKPLHWQWTGGVCSASPSDESHFHIYIGYPMACTVSGPHYPWFLSVGILERKRIEESPTRNREVQARYSRWNCAHKWSVVTPSYSTVLWIVNDSILQMKEATFKMVALKSIQKS